MLTESEAWKLLDTVPDPEVPAVSVVELGIIRELRCRDDGITVVVTPTYSGCPATEVIGLAIRDTLAAAGPAGSSSRPGSIHRGPATGSARRRARSCVPRHRAATGRAAVGGAQPIRFVKQALSCPRCGSRDTERLSEFGSTACKATYRCKSCLEPFEYFKPI